MPRIRIDRRAQLVDAARRAVALHGVDVRLKDVAALAEVTPAAVLYHFPDVTALLLEANHAGMERFHTERMRAIEQIDDPAERLVVTVEHGLPADAEDEAVRLMCELGGSAGRHPSHAAMLTALYDRQVAMYRFVLESGAANGDFRLSGGSLSIARNIVALEDAYGYRIVARHGSIDYDTAVELVLDFARTATGHPLARTRAEVPPKG